MRKLLKLIFSRLFIVLLLILLQLVVLVITLITVSGDYISIVSFIISLILAFFIINRDSNPSVKLPWAILVLISPLIGGLLYFLFGNTMASGMIKKRYNKLIAETAKYLYDDQEIIDELHQINSHIAKNTSYIGNISKMPVYKGCSTKYLSPGESFFKALCEELEKAERFIFMEYFIVEKGEFWNTVLDILIMKAQAGVEVRMIYDDVGCINTLPTGYWKKLNNLGIHTIVFNPLKPSLRISMQNRDHRKITVIDGHTAFTGGNNLADEYINARERFGHWKDSQLMIKGPAVWSFTLMFLRNWNFHNPTDANYYIYQCDPSQQPPLFDAKGYVQPYDDSPFDKEMVGESVYLNIINGANKYIYIMTPYFVVDNELVTALSLAAKSGVDVRIITPHIPDKWYVHMLTEAYYPLLIKSGIRIYEYTPGFIHTKAVVCDDNQATVGTVNFDYRSLYHHFECGVYMYETTAVQEVKADFLQTLTKCQEITASDCRDVKLPKRFIRGLLRFIAPLL